MSTPGDLLSDEERLRRFASLTDTALAYLNTEDLLVELLDRLCEMLSVDTAVVLLMDESRSHLVTTVARGLEDAVRQDVRVPVGQGFVGQIAADKSAAILDDVHQAMVPDPFTRDRGVFSLLGVPLVSQGTVMGVLQVGSLEPRRFTHDDVRLLQSAGDRMAPALEARSSNAQRSAAVMLQRSLVPARLPPVAGLSMAARYVPGEGGSVGGDWYDVFALPTGHVGVAVGDVVGHGLRAAVVMGRLRSALRAYALTSLDPGEVLTQLDRKLRHFEPSQMATLMYCVLDPMLEQIQLSSAGHLPAFKTDPSGRAVNLDVPPDVPLGVSFGAGRQTTTVAIAAEELLCLYTDGLVERRGEHLDLGLARLRSMLAPGDPEDVCGAIMASLVGRDEPKDDIALLVVKREPVPERNVLVVPAEPPALARIRVALRRWLAAANASDAAANDLLVAVCEAAANSVEHAYGPAGGTIEVALELGDGEVTATIRDNGSWRPARGRGRGRGMLLMERCSDEVRIDRSPAGTEVTLRRQLGGEKEP